MKMNKMEYKSILGLSCLKFFSIVSCFILLLQGNHSLAQNQSMILKNDKLSSYVKAFNTIDKEAVINVVPNDKSYEWLSSNIPLFECPDEKIEEVYYYRWWSFRKHLKETPQGYIFTEFITPVKHAGEFNSISCAIGHHVYEGRWLHNSEYINQYIDFWLKYEQNQSTSKFHKFSNWLSDAVYQNYLVKKDEKRLVELLPLLDKDYQFWEREHSLGNGLFWQYDVRDGMEESVSGGRHVKNARPTINSYMYANAVALSIIAQKAGNQDLQKLYKEKAHAIKTLIDSELWDEKASFYNTKLEKDNSFAAREAIGFIPWYFNIPDDSKQKAKAWDQLIDTLGFNAPWGLTTAERREPTFRTRGSGHGCEWDGALWPFATTQTLKGLGNFLTNYKHTGKMNKDVFVDELHKYANSHQMNGQLYLGEYQDEVTGEWLKGDNPRSEFYNHSAFADLVISGLVGLNPSDDGMLKIHPLIPANKWDWFCLDNVLYQGKLLTILWDKNGEKYGKGKGFKVFVDGKEVIKKKKLQPISIAWSKI
jgi:hypothetical protein